jgi:hypothetical protein
MDVILLLVAIPGRCSFSKILTQYFRFFRLLKIILLRFLLYNECFYCQHSQEEGNCPTYNS